MFVVTALALWAISPQAMAGRVESPPPSLRACPPDVPSATVTYRVSAAEDQPPVVRSVTACGEAVRVERGDVPAMPVAPPKVRQ